MLRDLITFTKSFEKDVKSCVVALQDKLRENTEQIKCLIG